MTCHTTRHDWGCRLHLTYLCAKYLDICQFYKNERKNDARDRSSSLNRPADLFKYIVASYFITISFHQIWSTLTFSFEKVISNLSFFHDMHFSCAVLTINRDWPLLILLLFIFTLLLSTTCHFQQATGICRQAKCTTGVCQQAKCTMRIRQQAKCSMGIYQQVICTMGICQQVKCFMGICQQAKCAMEICQQAKCTMGICLTSQMHHGNLSKKSYLTISSLVSTKRYLKAESYKFIEVFMTF